MANQISKMKKDQQYTMGTSAGSPGTSGISSMGGNTNKGLRSYKPGAIERAKDFLKNKLINSK